MNLLLLGSGALKIGEAGEFDYSGSQAIKALKEEGHRVVLVNPNIATIQTSADFADRVYFLPVSSHFVTRVIERERPDGLLLSFGGQTALNCGLALHREGVLDRYGVRVLGTPIRTIELTEDRQLFAERLRQFRDFKVARSEAATSIRGALRAAEQVGYPVIVRSAYALGGAGSGVAHDSAELADLCRQAFHVAEQVLIEEYLVGWKEIEYEVVRDNVDNCLTVCNMENFDPLGIHTGESIVVAPSQTLTNAEYHTLRSVAIAVIRELGVIGECNIQFAVRADVFDYRIIEVNARLSRSSALASKATGYPLAYIAAKLALGHALLHLKNKVTGVTTAAFEPALDYVVVKMPRWDLHKFRGADQRIGTSMKSVGEVMSIGRRFEEALQKAVRMLDLGIDDLLESPPFGDVESRDSIINPTPQRVFAIARALQRGVDLDWIAEQTGIDRWFLQKIQNVADLELQITRDGIDDSEILLQAKRSGISDLRLATLTRSDPESIRAQRIASGIVPFVSHIDTLAAEYPATTNYLYLTYNATEHDEARPDPGSIVVLGSGAYRIGSSVEFDWCSVTCATTLRSRGISVTMVNCNPETVSTDYDVCDRLYFEELTLERVRDIYDYERPQAMVLSVGGQTPNNLALACHRLGMRVLGTSPDNIDRAEDRHKFSVLLDQLRIDQPAWQELRSMNDALAFAANIGFPVLIRPSYVLSGAAMNVAYSASDLQAFLARAAIVSPDHPVVVSKFIENAKEIEVDAVAANGTLRLYAISEHVENAGVHSGDATIMLPPQRLYMETFRRVKTITKRISEALQITGPFNVQLIAKDNDVKVIECNLRASRSFPFVSKVTGYDFAERAVTAMLGGDISGAYQTVDLDYVAVKAPQFSFSRIHGADPILHVEMASTGEVACFGEDLYEAYLKSLLATGVRLPKRSVFMSLGGERNKERFLESARALADMRLHVYATEHTHLYLGDHGVKSECVRKIHEGGSPNVVEFLQNGKIDVVINLVDAHLKKDIDDDRAIRRATVDYGVPLFTNLQAADLFVLSLSRRTLDDLRCEPWDAYVRLQPAAEKTPQFITENGAGRGHTVKRAQGPSLEGKHALLAVSTERNNG
jgi:carbamoyl-phosphate synthase large subunit